MNLFENLNVPQIGENFETLYKKDGVLIERIVSSDKLEQKEYNQPYDEWLILLEGEARMQIKDKTVVLKKGDTQLIQKDTPHQVLATKKGTVWLCIHLKNR